MSEIGKQVAGRCYFHISVAPRVDPATSGLVERAVAVTGARADVDYNVVRVEEANGTVALLSYPDFFEDPFPALARSWKVSLDSGRTSLRSYIESLNPPVLHRKELLLDESHPDRQGFSRLTAELEALGCFDDPVRIGFRVQWEQVLKERGFRTEGHQLVPIGNAEPPSQTSDESSGIARHLTALTRTNFSAPIQALRRFGYLDGSRTLFDYGCGKGDDVRGLVASGIGALGWDPYYANSAEVVAADLVNLGFVINVIEDPVERRDALTRAYSLAKELLVVSTMIATDNEAGTPYGDGVLTSRVTFQKYFAQSELRDYLTATLKELAIPIAPGIVFVFKDKEAEQRFLSSRLRSPIRVQRPPLMHVRQSYHSKTEPRPRKLDLYEVYKDHLESLWRQWVDLGREPEENEVVGLQEIKAAVGSLRRAFRLVSQHYDMQPISRARAQRSDDVKVYLALQQFQQRTPYSKLEARLQRDVRVFFGTYTSAQEHAMYLLAQAAKPEVLNEACRIASEDGLGHFEPSQSLQLHSALVPRLPAVLRLYVACAGILFGDTSQCDLVKIHIRSGKVSFIKYDDFLGKAIPKMVERAKIDLRKLDFKLYSYGGEYLCPPLYFKSRYINEEIPHFAEQVAFDEALVKLGLDWSGFGPSESSLISGLEKQHLQVTGFRIERLHRVPDLDERCGRYLTYRQLIECGETQRTTGTVNRPVNPESYTALFDLASSILDPVIEYFGGIELTYGFCSVSLARWIPGRIAPELDQHAAHERKKNGNPVCARLGAAVDFLVRDENMQEVAQWIIDNLPFDRLYYYGADRPLHVSCGPEQKREAIEMSMTSAGRRVPRRFAQTST